MPINRDQEYLDISSASEDSADDEYNGGRTKKSKGKGIDRRTRDKGKGKAPAMKVNKRYVPCRVQKLHNAHCMPQQAWW